MTDHFQLTAIIATAIRECRAEALTQPGVPNDQHPNDVEEAICIAKAVVAAIADAGFEISPKRAAAS